MAIVPSMITIKDIKQEMDEWRCRMTLLEVLPPKEDDKPLQKIVFANEEVSKYIFQL